MNWIPVTCDQHSPDPGRQESAQGSLTMGTEGLDRDTPDSESLTISAQEEILDAFREINLAAVC